MRFLWGFCHACLAIVVVAHACHSQGAAIVGGSLGTRVIVESQEIRKGISSRVGSIGAGLTKNISDGNPPYGTKELSASAFSALPPESGYLGATARARSQVTAPEGAGILNYDTHAVAISDATALFDEPVRIAVRFAMVESGGSFGGGAIDINGQRYSGQGSLRFVSSFLNASVTAGAGGRILVSDYPEHGLPRSASMYGFACGAIVWSFVPLDSVDPPVFAGDSPDVVIVSILVDDPSDSTDQSFFDPADPPDLSNPSENRIGPGAGDMYGARYMAIPAVDEVGLARDAYFGLPTRIDDGDLAGARLDGYLFCSDDNVFQSFRVPELPAGVTSLTVRYDDQTISVVAGQLVEFAGPGVVKFEVTGFDPLLADPADDAFVLGLQFATPGLASVYAAPIVNIPVGDFNRNGMVDGSDFLMWQRRLGDSPALPGTGPDGVADGVIDASDLALWKERFAQPTAIAAASAALPEPSTFASALLAIATLSYGRRRCSGEMYRYPGSASSPYPGRPGESSAFAPTVTRSPPSGVAAAVGL